MNNQWLNDLRRKMEDHTEDVPDGLWDDIREELFKEDQNIVGLTPEPEKLSEENKKGTVHIKPLIYRVAGIAAAIALLFIIVKQLPENNGDVKLTPEIAHRTNGKIKEYDNSSDTGKSLIENPGTGSGPKENTKGNNEYAFVAGRQNILQSLLGKDVWERVNASRNIHSVQPDIKETSLFTALQKSKAEIIESTAPQVEAGNKVINRRDEIRILISETDAASQSIAAHTAKEKKQKSKTSWMLSMLTGKASSNSQQYPGYATMSGQPLSIDDVWSTSQYHQDPFVEVLLANQSQNVEAKVRHKVPLNLGVSLYYNLGKKWGIGTGLNYTKLSSELHSGSQSNFVKSEQTVHYIGIPVQVNYNVIRKGNFTGYITGGALVEKSVAGNFKTKYVVNNVVTDETKEGLPSQPVQVSLNTALGVQLKIVDKIGIYAEPGIGYHFKDNSSLNTIYKEKPLNFNVKFGVRVLLD